MTNLEITSEPRKDAVIVHLKGLLDAYNHIVFREAVDEQVKAGQTRIVVDFTQLTYLGSSGLEVILAHIQPVRNAGGDIVLCGLSPKIFKVFDLLGLPSFFTITGTVDEALAAFHG
jgi:anti-sigma B factor antagonist